MTVLRQQKQGGENNGRQPLGGHKEIAGAAPKTSLRSKWLRGYGQLATGQ